VRGMLGLCLGLTIALASNPSEGGPPAKEGPFPWTGWSDSVFERARRENRFVLLDLEAVWCHWCHVMEKTTYHDPAVAALIKARYIAVKVDQDARPDLSNRYEDYGWPATIVFDGNGKELVKFSGYITPQRMRSLLQAIIDDPTPGPSAGPENHLAPSESDALPLDLREEMIQALDARYDSERGGWGTVHKFLDGDSVEYSLTRAAAGDKRFERMARETLTAQLKLLDPVWGGVYQYSDSGDWDHPHFEKIMSVQAENMRTYAQAYALWHEHAHLEAARAIQRYLDRFLRSSEGVFYTSQDADIVPGEHGGEYFALGDAERLKRGVPRVDRHSYARENAWVAEALVALHGATSDPTYLDEALRAARWILAERALAGGGFGHDASDANGPYLGDSLASGRAFLRLYAATGDRSWLRHSEAAADFIETSFKGEAGYVTALSSSPLNPQRPEREENVSLARFTNLLFCYTGKANYRDMAGHAMKYLSTPSVARRFSPAGILLADLELRTEPLHITVVGRKDDPEARALLATAAGQPSWFKRVELWDKTEGKLPRGDVEYPELKTAAAFVCTKGRCSAPAFTPGMLKERIQSLLSSEPLKP